MAGELDGQRALAVRRELHVCDLLADHDGVDQRHLLAGDAQHADRAVGAVGYQTQRASPVDRHAGRLLADHDRVDQRRRAGVEIDHPQPVVRHLLPGATFLHHIHRIGDQGQAGIGRDGEIGRRADDGVGQRQVDEDLRRQRVGANVDDRDRVPPGRANDGLAGIVPALLLVVTDDHQLPLPGHGRRGRTSCQYG